jgi:hypothetical protein
MYRLGRIADGITNNTSCSKNSSLIVCICYFVIGAWKVRHFFSTRRHISDREGHVRTQKFLLAGADPEGV